MTVILAGALELFLLTFPALLAIINPISGALAFLAFTRGADDAARAVAARTIAVYGFVLLNVSLWVGAYVLQFFGITLGVLRVGGGFVVAAAAWNLLNADDPGESESGPGARGADLRKLAFYPLTMPLTVGPGSISVAIALGTSRPRGLAGMLEFLVAATAATLLCCAAIYFAYRYAERVAARFGQTGTRIVARLSAFLLFCIGLQVCWLGLRELLGELLAAAPRG
jgi:multiple antibiotic resistance protein